MAVKNPIIAIVGRPNVGKSTLFNRVLGENKAVVEDTPGVTRDRNYARVERFSVPFIAVDTGGLSVDAEEELGQLTTEQALTAVAEADALIALFDGKAGLQPQDKEVCEVLRRFPQKTIRYVVNKCDGEELEVRAADFYALGCPDLNTISALNGRNVKALVEDLLQSLPNYSSLLASAESIRRRLDEVEASLPKEEKKGDKRRDCPDGLVEVSAEVEWEEKDKPERPPAFAPVFIPGESSETAEQYERRYKLREPVRRTRREPEPRPDEEQESEGAEPSAAEPIECISIAVIGRPNVGKSTLLNKLLGSERAITSSEPGTTRDSIDVEIRRDGQLYRIVDTAGLRRRTRVEKGIERYSVLRALKVLGDADVAVVVLDATREPSEQDAAIIGLAHEQGKGIVIAVNKWDAVEKDHRSVRQFSEKVREVSSFAAYAPLVFISAKSGRRCPQLIAEVRSVAYARSKWVATAPFNRVLSKAVGQHSPPVRRGRPVKLFYGAQVDVCPPRFALVFNYPRSVHFSYLRFLKNCIREEFGFVGTDLKLVTRKR